MSFCEDMLIYNVMTKKMVVGNKSNVTSDLSVTPTTEYQTIAKFMPELNGDVNLVINMQSLAGGLTKNHMFSVYDEDGNSIYEYNHAGSESINFNLTNLKAFKQYYIKFKVESLGGAVYKPTQINIYWDVIDNIGINNILTNDF